MAPAGPDFWQLPDGRFVFAYLTHATQYTASVQSFIGSCDENFDCTWPEAGQGMYDLSRSFVASQSFTDPRGRRVLFGWINGTYGNVGRRGRRACVDS